MIKKVLFLILFIFTFFALSVFAAGPSKLHLTYKVTSDYGSAKYGYVDDNGKLRIDYIYDYAEEFSEGLALVMKNRKAYFINEGGFAVFNSKTSIYKYIEGFKDGRALVRIGNKYGYIDTNGYVIIPAIYDDASSFKEGKAAVCKDNKYGFINTNGKVVIDFLYDGANSFSNGIARISKNNKYGFIDSDGKKLTPFIYERTGSFSSGLCPVKIDGKYTFINLTGDFLLPPMFDWASDFTGELATISYNENFGYINTKGDIVISPKYSSLSGFCDGYLICSKTNKYSHELFGVIDKNETIRIPFIYNSITYLSDNLFLVKQDSGFGVINNKNKCLLESIYDNITRDGNILTAKKNKDIYTFDINDIQPQKKGPTTLKVLKFFPTEDSYTNC